MRVSVLPVRFGFSKPSAVPSRHSRYYDRIVSACFSDRGTGANIELHCDNTLPLGAERSLPYESVAELLITSFPSDASNVLLDIGGPDEKDVTPPSALVGLVLAVGKLRVSNPDTAIAILLPFAISDGDLILPSIQRLVEDPMVRLITSDGTVSGRHFSDTKELELEIARWSAEARIDAVDALQKRLVRRVGQYQLPGAPGIIRHLYDGSRAFGEIYELTAKHLAEFVECGSGRIGYDVRHSHWFRGPVEAALRDAGLSGNSWTLGDEIDCSLLRETGLLLLPIIRTGASFSKLISSAVGLGHIPRVWSLLSTQGTEARDGTRRISIPMEPARQRYAQVQYSLRVDAGDEAPDLAFWQTAPLEPLDPNEEATGEMLTADAMWGMILEAGLKAEDPVPRHRDSIGFTPDFGTLAKLNGPFIATKVEGLLSSVFAGALPPSIGFLCPAEPNAIQVAESLRDLVGHDTIFVDRSLIDARINPSAVVGAKAKAKAQKALGKVQDKLEAWQKLVRRVSDVEKPHIVLLDEFNLTGRTFRGLFNLALEFDLPVLCTMSLVSYSDRPEGLDVPHLALYHMGRVH